MRNGQAVQVGDIYAIGEAQIQVTGPRYPCWKIERRWDIDGLTDRVAASGRTGWYCRVLREGLIEPGTIMTLVERPYPQWTVALTNDFCHNRNKDLATAQALADCPLLHEFWKELVVRRAKATPNEFFRPNRVMTGTRPPPVLPSSPCPYR